MQYNTVKLSTLRRWSDTGCYDLYKDVLLPNKVDINIAKRYHLKEAILSKGIETISLDLMGAYKYEYKVNLEDTDLFLKGTSVIDYD